MVQDFISWSKIATGVYLEVVLRFSSFAYMNCSEINKSPTHSNLISIKQLRKYFTMSYICLGPKGSGKTHLLTALQHPNSVDNTTYSIPTVGTSIFTVTPPLSNDCTSKKTNEKKSYKILEIGGAMAPLWRRYFCNVNKIIYVVDTSNLCQISAAGVLLYSILAEPRLQRTKFLLVLTKMDLAYRQMRNEALLMLQMVKLKKQIRQNLTIVEVSAISSHGFEDIYKWLNLP